MNEDHNAAAREPDMQDWFREALDRARQEGHREGLEEAAKVVGHQAPFRPNGMQMLSLQRELWAGLNEHRARLAAAIRALATGKE